MLSAHVKNTRTACALHITLCVPFSPCQYHHCKNAILVCPSMSFSQ